MLTIVAKAHIHKEKHKPKMLPTVLQTLTEDVLGGECVSFCPQMSNVYIKLTPAEMTGGSRKPKGNQTHVLISGTNEHSTVFCKTSLL